MAKAAVGSSSTYDSVTAFVVHITTFNQGNNGGSGSVPIDCSVQRTA